MKTTYTYLINKTIALLLFVLRERLLHREPKCRHAQGLRAAQRPLMKSGKRKVEVCLAFCYSGVLITVRSTLINSKVIPQFVDVVICNVESLLV